MTESIAFLLYAGIFRLAIVATGALAIWLGFRLFATLASAPAAGAGETDAHAQVGDVRFGIKRAAPGTCFALFGAALISVMLVQGPPEFQRRDDGASGGSISIKGGAPEAGHDALDSAMAAADAHLRADRPAQARTAYQRALTDPTASLGAAARALNQLAWLAHRDGDNPRATVLAELAVGLDPTNEAYIDTLTRARHAGGLAAQGQPGPSAEVER